MIKNSETKYKNCGKCKIATLHYRNGGSTSFLMGTIHVILIIVTLGLWLIPLILHRVLTTKIGGWKCTQH